MTKIISLKRNTEFQRLYKKGKSFVKPSFVIYAVKTKGDTVRLGITASKKIGCAVKRNRVKRRIRELFRSELKSLNVGYDICIVARSKMLDEPYENLKKDFYDSIKALGLLKN